MAKTSVPGAAGSSAQPTPRQAARPAPTAPNPAPPDTSALSLKQLAKAVVARTVKPRAADIRRLAEGVLAAVSRKEKGAKKDGVKNGKGRKAKQKLAKIPGQKRKT